MNSVKDCPICLVKYDDSTHYPMIAGECGHTICLKCSSDLKLCPVCYGQVFKNLIRNKALVEETRKPGDAQIVEKHQSNKENAKEVQTAGLIKPINCPNGHRTKWLGQEFKCATCNRLSFGWHCLECKYLQCDICAGTVFVDRVCPNGQKTVWKGEISLNNRNYSIAAPEYLIKPEPQSLNAKNFSSYWQQRACSGYLTYRLKNTEVLNTSVKHPHLYSSDVSDKPKLSGWTCDQCLYIRCTFCDKTLYRQHSCPNDHPTKWYGEDWPCTVCSVAKVGWKCKNCLYNICDKCAEKNEAQSKYGNIGEVKPDKSSQSVLVSASSSICLLF